MRRDSASVWPLAHLRTCSPQQPAQGTAAAPGAAQDLNLTNGRIHTMDARNTVVSAVAIRNGRIASGGQRRARAHADTRVIDLRGRTVVPGLVEAHIHSVSLANRPGYHTILENTTSIREIQEALAARRKSVPEGQWITSMGGWHPNQWAEHRHPTLKELDEAVPDRPVLLYERFTGPAVTNSLGKKFFDAARCRARPCIPDIKKIAVADNGVIAAAGFAGGGPSASALFHLRRHADVRGQEAQHAGRDGLLGQRRPDRASRPGALPDSGSAASESDPVEPRSVPDVRHLAGAPSRRPRRSSACR